MNAADSFDCAAVDVATSNATLAHRVVPIGKAAPPVL